jgi:hypothetical protein
VDTYTPFPSDLPVKGPGVDIPVVSNHKDLRNRRLSTQLKALFLMVHPAGFEPATYGFVGRNLDFPNLLKIHNLLKL